MRKVALYRWWPFIHQSRRQISRKQMEKACPISIFRLEGPRWDFVVYKGNIAADKRSIENGGVQATSTSRILAIKELRGNFDQNQKTPTMFGELS